MLRIELLAAEGIVDGQPPAAVLEVAGVVGLAEAWMQIFRPRHHDPSIAREPAPQPRTRGDARHADIRAIITRMTDRTDLDQLISRAQALAATGSRRLLGICGAPGAGKSTLAERVVTALGDGAVLVGMDGFHLSQRELRRLGREQRKGAADTFDAAGYVDLIRRLRRNGPDQPDAETVYAPEFRRDIEEPIACAVPVPPEVPLVVTEGNYLLLSDHPWSALRALLDEVWFLAPDESARIARLVERHRRYGRSYVEAHDRAYGSDQVNAVRILATAGHADLVLRDPVPCRTVPGQT